MYKLSILAADDFAGIYEYTLVNFGAKQADRYTDDMENCLQTLIMAPGMGREYAEIKPGIRRFDHQQHAIFYRIRDHDIFIIRILHQQMEPMIHLLDI
ncbi:Toxin ParE1 [Serratia plymuthica]|uniref:type II toxin-antitoxin system RelE/ParE family toxin n=1 Tax=Serratia plymuthica TaxID=82996 RepID=UPI00034BE56E|nr:type II toxin-antitoxin system RelE/ParE family toxin [Serratia plymuthica]QJW55839.1 Toxin ParE1 [Serratia plymuthica]